MEIRMNWIWKFLCICLTISLVASDKCIIDESLRANNLATKTPYEYTFDPNTNLEFPKNCEPSKIWLVSRHGTRYPSKKGIDAINHVLPGILNSLTKSKLCAKDIELLEKWQPVNLSPNHAKKLHAEGEKELLLMAERFQFRLKSLLEQDYHEDNFKFRATNTQRAEQSQFHFATGLFGRKEAYKIKYEDPIEPFDPVIRFYKGCQKWKTQVKHNISSLKEQRLFESSLIFKKELLEPLSEIFQEDINLNELEAIWVGCNFGQAWQPQKLSPWCGILTEHQRNLLEYRENLEYFYVDSYGHHLNYDQACVLMQDVFESFKESRNSTFYFTHSGTILKFLAYLNVNNPDVKPMHDNFDAAHKWTTSHFDSFASNVAFVLLSCDKVGMFLNEKLTVIPGCNDIWCQFDEFENLYKTSKKVCDFHQICDSQHSDDHYISDDDRY